MVLLLVPSLEGNPDKLQLVGLLGSGTDLLYLTWLPQVRKWSGKKRFFKLREKSGKFTLN